MFTAVSVIAIGLYIVAGANISVDEEWSMNFDRVAQISDDWNMKFYRQIYLR